MQENSIKDFLRYTRDINEVIDPITRSTHLHKVKTIEDAELLILAGAHLNLKNDDSKTVLFYVEEINLFKFLVEKGASINICDRAGNSLLCYKKNPQIVEYLLKQGLQPNKKNKYDEDSMFCVETYEIASLLIKYGYEVVNPKLFFRIKNLKILELLLQNWPKDKPILNEVKETPLYFTGNVEIIKLFIKYGIDVNSQNASRETVLHICKDPEIINILLQNGADTTIENSLRNSPIFNINSLEVLNMFIKNGANVNSYDDKGETLLFKDDLSFEIKKRLIDAGIEIHHKNNEGKTVLHEVKDVNLAKLYLDNGGSLKKKDYWKRSPLFYFNNTEILKLFIERGAKIDSNDSNGLYPFFNSQNLEQLKIFLENLETEVKTIKTKDKRNILFWITDVDMAKFLVEEHDVDPYQLSDENRTILFYIKDVELIKYYLKLGIDPNHRDSRRQTFLDFNNRMKQDTKRIVQKVVFELNKAEVSDSEDDE